MTTTYEEFPAGVVRSIHRQPIYKLSLDLPLQPLTWVVKRQKLSAPQCGYLDLCLGLAQIITVHVSSRFPTAASCPEERISECPSHPSALMVFLPSLL